jgi:hypothetical protein
MNWTKVVTEPLGLAGFALSLVFGVIARWKKSDGRRWMFPAAISMAGVALVGGLSLAYLRARKDAVPPAKIKQTSSGCASPNIANVNGDVTYTLDASACQQAAPTPAPTSEKKPH